MNDYYRPERFPPVVKNLLIVNALVYIAQVTFGANSFTIDNLFALHDVHSDFFKPHQLLTYMFMHGSFNHLLFNMLALWVFGSQLENYWGAKRFLQYFIICGLGAGLLHLGVLYFETEAGWKALLDANRDLISNNPGLDLAPQRAAFFSNPQAITVGASGAVFGCLVAFGYLFPNMLIYLYFLIPIKAKWLVIIYGGLELVMAIRNSTGDNVAHFAHLGGAVTGIIMLFIWNKTKKRTLY